jgi:hypothetical protein
MIYDRTAIERVKENLARPDISDQNEASVVGEFFDPWEALFPHLYGGYSNDFGQVAIESLKEVMTVSHLPHFDSLPHKMFKEMLCVQELCEYGVSPRGCFPEREFGEIIEEFIRRFEHYEKVKWNV